MNWIVCRSAWKECLRNNLRMCLLAFFFLFPIAKSTIVLCTEKVTPDALIGSRIAVYFVLIWGAGVIGRHLQDGTLSLVLSRPITVTQLVMSKWFALGTAAGCTAILQLIAELIVAVTRGPLPTTLEIVSNGLERVLVAYGVSASIILLSTLVGGVKDLGLFSLGYVLQEILQSLSEIKADAVKDPVLKSLANFGLASAAYAGSILGQFLTPKFEIYQWVLGRTMPWLEFFGYFALLTGSLSLAIFLLNRKELPYGAA